MAKKAEMDLKGYIMDKKILNILIGLAIGVTFFLIALAFFTQTQAYLIGIIAFMVTLWTNEALPLGVVSLFPIILFPAFNILSTNATSINYSKSIIFLFLGGFMLAIAVEKTNLHKVIANKILSLFPATPRGIIYSLSITSASLSSFLSNTTTALLLLPIGMFISENPKLKMRFVLAIAYGASIGGIITPIGTPPNLILLGIMEDKGMEMIPFLKWIFMVLPLALIMLIFTGWILSLGVKNIPIKMEKFKTYLTKEQKKVSFAILALIAILLINTPIKPYYLGLGLNEKGLLLFFGLLMFMPPFNILKWEDSKKIPFEIIFLFGAGFAIAKAFSNTKLDSAIAQYLIQIGDINPYLILLFIAALITFTTEITSNTALTSIMLPVIYSFATSEGSIHNPTLFLLVATICASYAFMLPIATPPNAIAMSSGAIRIKDMAKIGFILNIAGILFISLIAFLFWSKVL